jgi:hypothetical protein
MIFWLVLIVAGSGGAEPPSCIECPLALVRLIESADNRRGLTRIGSAKLCCAEGKWSPRGVGGLPN